METSASIAMHMAMCCSMLPHRCILQHHAGRGERDSQCPLDEVIQCPYASSMSVRSSFSIGANLHRAQKDVCNNVLRSCTATGFIRKICTAIQAHKPG